VPKLGDTLKLYLSNNFPGLHCENQLVDPKTKLPCQCPACKKLNKLYHPSMVEFYKPAKEQEFEYNGFLLSKKLLESPVIGSFKNPMAMRTLHELRKLVNYFIKEEIIDEETRIVVETARDLNDANMRWAIEEYQREREKENKEIAKVIKELRGEERDAEDIDKARLLIEQNPDYFFDCERYISEKEQENADKKKKKTFGKTKDFQYKKDVTKYHLWLEQGMQCIYTGKIINIYNLFDENSTDFEHTIPRSLSFDNSLANLTICDSYYNRHIKINRLPTQLENYNKDAIIKGQLYSAIKPRLEKWEQKVEQFRNNLEFWVKKSKQAQPGDIKNYAIRQRHLWKMELEYWQTKLDRFTMNEVTNGYKHSQLNDTRLITKYAYHYMKSVFSKVEVQKGSITADFRKMLGVQSVYEKKDQEKHSKHALDAAILSLIPVAAKRDRMLELFYLIQEEKKLNRNIDDLVQALQNEIRTCQIGNVSNLAQYIEENILINHISNDQTLTPAKRKMRQKGKVVWIRDENGNIKKDSDGKGIPKYWLKGDCLRGQLHKDTYYGAITQAIKEEKKDIKGNALRDKNDKSILTFKRNDNGEIITTKEIFFVIREELKYKKSDQDKGFKDLEELRNKIVDKDLFKIIEKQCEGKSFKDSCEEGLYMLDKKGNKVNRIRHIRCFDKSIKNPLTIKKQTYKSKKPYKQNYYAGVGDLYVMCKYVNKTQKPIYKIYSLFDISENRKYNLEGIPKTDEQGNEFALALKSGDTVLLYKSNSDEVLDMNQNELSKRLYTILGFENPSRINLKRHLNAMKDTDLGKGESIKDFNNLPEKIRCSVNTLNFLVEGKDFKMNLNGTIKFKF
jgi:CRISPR-associated endonuclease Csn1